MRLLIVFFVLLSLSEKSFSLSLLQEEKAIACQSEQSTVVIEARDRYFEVNSKRFQLVEFLDSAILARSHDKEYALIQLLPKNQAVVIQGALLDFVERDCRQVKAHKVCRSGSVEIGWAPTWLEAESGRLPLIHYQVYPNDGTGFVAMKKGEGLALIDFGSKFQIVSGQAQRLDCHYQVN